MVRAADSEKNRNDEPLASRISPIELPHPIPPAREEARRRQGNRITIHHDEKHPTTPGPLPHNQPPQDLLPQSPDPEPSRHKHRKRGLVSSSLVSFQPMPDDSRKKGRRRVQTTKKEMCCEVGRWEGLSREACFYGGAFPQALRA